jgi:hypothetical protein
MFFVWLLRLFSWLLFAISLLVPTFLYLLLPLLNTEQAIAIAASGLFASALCGTLGFIAGCLNILVNGRQESEVKHRGNTSHFDF